MTLKSGTDYSNLFTPFILTLGVDIIVVKFSSREPETYICYQGLKNKGFINVETYGFPLGCSLPALEPPILLTEGNVNSTKL